MIWNVLFLFHQIFNFSQKCKVNIQKTGNVHTNATPTIIIPIKWNSKQPQFFRVKFSGILYHADCYWTGTNILKTYSSTASPCWCKHYDPLIRQELFTGCYGIISLKTWIFNNTAVRKSKESPTLSYLQQHEDGPLCCVVCFWEPHKHGFMIVLVDISLF